MAPLDSVAPAVEQVTDDNTLLSEASEDESEMSEVEGDVTADALEADDLVEIDASNIIAPNTARSTRATTFSDAGLPAEEEDSEDTDFIAADDE